MVKDVGSRLELFVDDFLIGELRGGARQVLHHPQPRDIVLTHDRAWEGNTSGYHTFFRDGDRVRVFYRGEQWDNADDKESHPSVTCTAESVDGIHWQKPSLGLIEFQGSRANNIVYTGVGAHNFAPFRDTRPDVPPEHRYKALASGDTELYAFVSPDGFHWAHLVEKPVITDGAFDSQNLAFWDDVRGEYRAFYRDKMGGQAPDWLGVRWIKTATSSDFVHWTEGKWLEFPDAPTEQLYTNQVLPYFRAPHILLGFPTRFMKGIAVANRGGITEGLLMSSRDGEIFHRWGEALIRPGLNRDRWGNRCNYIWHGLIETPSDLPGGPNELSLYSTEHYCAGSANRVRRFTLRMDGFVSINAPLSGGELLTPPIIYRGEQLVLNVSTAAAGSVRVELQDADGGPLDGFTLDDSDEIWGDTLEWVVTWKDGADVSRFMGQPVRVRFVMSDADLYALRFLPAGQERWQVAATPDTGSEESNTEVRTR